MALTKEDLQAIAELMDSKLEPMQADIKAVNTRLDTIQADITDLKGDVSSLKADMAHHNHYVEPLLKAVKDGVDGILEHNQQLDRLEDKFDGHDHRIWALEQARKAQ